MSDDTIFINRELSWLDFNRRVLALGKDKNVPLAERVKFLAIYGSNLDEFFMVRVGSLQERANLEQEQGKKVKRENKTNMSAAEQLTAIMPKTAQLQEECDKYYAKALEALAECGWRKVDLDHLSKEDEHFWKKYFQTELFPILSPQIVDNRHPFPFLRNKEIYLGVLLKEKHPAWQSLGIIPISSQMERMHVVKKDGETQFALTEELVLHFAASIFGKETIQEKCLFRVTRNADIDVKEGMMDHDIDYREIMTELLKRRRKLAAVRLQITPAPAPEVERLLCNRLLLTHKRVFEQKSPLDLSFFYKLTGRMEAEGRPELFYPAARPMLPPPDYDLAAEVQKHDVLLSYPYQSIRPFIAMLKKAAHDPEVISIKMTLYRMARESQIVQALMEAAENGKEVVALVELRARFDEQNNIDWSKQLESAGCTVIYGFDDYKVHSKLTLITKKSKEGYSYITQIGTGNYNEKTSELYTDYSFITADHGIGEEASNVFQNLAVQKLTEESDRMLVAPLRFKSVLLEEMDRVIAAARMGHNAIMTPESHCYLDHYQDDPETQPLAFGACVPIGQTYSYDPAPDSLESDICKYILGVQGNVWAEYLPTYEHAEYMIYPRIIALAEVGWTPMKNKHSESFKRRINNEIRHIKAIGYNPFTLSELVQTSQTVDYAKKRIMLSLTSEKHPIDIRYTTDGSEPTASSKLYKKPFAVKDSI